MPIFGRKNKREVRDCPVYATGSVLGARPLYIVTAAERRWYLDSGAARSIHRGKAIQLTVTPAAIRGQSCIMGPRVIVGYAAGSRFYGSLVAAWVGGRG